MTPNRAVTAKWMQSVRLLDVAAVACLVAAVMFLLWPTRITTTAVPSGVTAESIAPLDSASAIDAGAAMRVRQTTDSLRTAIVQGNLFSASRRAPAVRFSAPGLANSDGSAVTESGVETPEPGASGMSTDSNAISLPHLSGIVMQQGVRMALVQFSEADAMPHLYREGDTHAGYRIVRIGDNLVVVAYRGGTRTLRLIASAPPPSFPDTQELP